MTEIDEIPLSKTILWVADYFSLANTVVLVESLREEGEDDDEFAIRLSKQWMLEYYGWDLDSVCDDVGVVEE